MSRALLTENQRRHLTTYLHLLMQDIERLRLLPQLRESGERHRSVQDAMGAVEEIVQRLLRAFDLPDREPPDVTRQVAAVANVWAARAPELRARRLRRYGPVDHRLAERLDPVVEELTRRLFALADAAARSVKEREAC